MFPSTDESHRSRADLAKSDPDLLRSNIPEYSFVGFAGSCAANTVTLTVGLVTGLPYPESRPIRVLISRDECRELAAALERLAQPNHLPSRESSNH
jgi:hypothetical protein